MLKHIHLSEVYNAGGVAKAAPLAFSFLFLQLVDVGRDNALVLMNFLESFTTWQARKNDFTFDNKLSIDIFFKIS